MRNVALIITVSLLAALFASAVRADSEAMPRSWMEKTPDGLHVFVMLGLHGLREAELNGDEDTDVPADYALSGLYHVGDTKSPLYTVDWYAHSVDLSTDGRYLVRRGPWASSRESLAVAFYENGNLLAAYRVGDLMLFTVPWHHSVSHFEWQEESQFDPGTNKLAMSTHSWTSYTFDAETGEIVSFFRGDYLLVGTLSLMLLAIVVGIIRHRRRRKAQ
jgi:hypothetical protein